MDQPDASRSRATTRRQGRIGPLARLALGPIVLGLLAGGCGTATGVVTDVGDLLVEAEDGEASSENASYRSLHEVPTTAPAVSSADERAALTAALEAERDAAQRTAAAIRERDAAGNGQVRAVYRPAPAAADAPLPDGA